MYLPFPPGRATLKSFWLVMSVSLGLVSGYLVHMVFSSGFLVLWGLLTVIFAIPGVLRPEIASLPCRAFNKLVSVFAQYATEVLSLACFAVVCTAVGKKGHSLRLAKPTDAASLWVPQGEDAIGNDVKAHGASGMVFPRGNWVSILAGWAVHSGNWWMLSMLPYMFLISIFSKNKQTASPPAHIYTLY